MYPRQQHSWLAILKVRSQQQSIGFLMTVSDVVAMYDKCNNNKEIVLWCETEEEDYKQDALLGMVM